MRDDEFEALFQKKQAKTSPNVQKRTKNETITESEYTKTQKEEYSPKTEMTSPKENEEIIRKKLLDEIDKDFSFEEERPVRRETVQRRTPVERTSVPRTAERTSVQRPRQSGRNISENKQMPKKSQSTHSSKRKSAQSNIIFIIIALFSAVFMIFSIVFNNNSSKKLTEAQQEKKEAQSGYSTAKDKFEKANADIGNIDKELEDYKAKIEAAGGKIE